jgi:CheY-like chemotaxis protein
MRDPMQDQAVGPVKIVLILDDDAVGSEALQHTLDTLGYRTRVMSDADAALDTLRTSPEPVALFFDVEAPGGTLDGQSYTVLIGKLLEDETLASRHIYAVISSSAGEVEWALGKALDRLGAPVFSKPCAATALETYLALARGRMRPPSPPVVATI